MRNNPRRGVDAGAMCFAAMLFLISLVWFAVKEYVPGAAALLLSITMAAQGRGRDGGAR